MAMFGDGPSHGLLDVKQLKQVFVENQLALPAAALVLVFLKITIDLLAHRQDRGTVDRAEELVF